MGIKRGNFMSETGFASDKLFITVTGHKELYLQGTNHTTIRSTLGKIQPQTQAKTLAGYMNSFETTGSSCGPD
jgi:hypothetical protein